MKSAWAVFVLFSLSLLSLPASAAPKIELDLSSHNVGVGQKIRVQATVKQSDGDPEPSSPKLRVPRTARVQGPSIGSQFGFSFGTGRGGSSHRSITATWLVTPTKEGVLEVGPVTFQWGNQTLTSTKFQVQVSKEPQRTTRRRDPFIDPFGADPFDFLTRRRSRRRQLPDAPEELQTQKALDPDAFLVGSVDKKKVVLGEPVRVLLVAYGSRGDFHEGFVREPEFADFVSYLAVENSVDQPAYRHEIDGVPYVVRTVRELVVVPLKTGVLEVGAMQAVIQGRRRPNYPAKGHQQGVLVKSEPLRIEVVEPPKKGRPDGYIVGDVGRYKMSAQVSPKKVQQNEYLEVLVTLKGKGEIPSKLLIPEGPEVRWEAPTIKGGPEIRDGELQGERIFKYLVQVLGQGKLELGEIKLPYYDADAGKYRTARVRLGSVLVEEDQRPSAPTKKNDSPADTQVSTSKGFNDGGQPLLARTDLGAYQARAVLRPPAWSWWLIWGVPPSLFALSGLFRLLKRVAPRGGGKKNRAQDRLAQAKKSIRAGEHLAALRELEGALVEAIEDSTGVRARGVMRSQLAQEMTAAGVGEGVAQEIQEWMEKLEAARYGEQPSQFEDWPVQVGSLMKKLPRPKKKRSKS